MKFKEYAASKVENKGLAQLLFEMRYKDKCNIPNKLPIFDFTKKNNIPYADFIWTGDINDLNISNLPDNFCLKPVDGCTSRGVFLMNGKLNLRTGKEYSDLNEIKSDYIEESKANIGYSRECYVESLHLDKKGDIPEDISVFMIKGVPGAMLQARRIGKNKIKCFYDGEWNEIESTGFIEKPEKAVEIIQESKKIMAALNVPFMRIDFYCYSGKYYLGELTPVSGIPGTLSASFSEMRSGKMVDSYLGHLLENSFENPFDKFDDIFVINLKEHPERLKRFEKHAKEYGIKYKVFNAIKHEIGSYGCSLSHLEIIKYAKRKGLKNVLVFEDDAYFVYPKFYVWQEVEKYFSTECDVFYLGCIAAWNGTSEIIKGEEIEYKSVLGRHALVYNESFYDYWINQHPDIEEFKFDRNKRGDLLLANSPVIKKGCFPVAAVDAKCSCTGTNAMVIEEPLKQGYDHKRLILAGYAAAGLLDYGMLTEKVKKIIFKKSLHLEKRIRELFLQSDPFIFIDETRYINLFRDHGRKKDTEQMFQEYGINAKKFNAIENKNGWAGSTLSHRGCILWAKMMNRENVLIFEDDAKFIHSPEIVKNMIMQGIYDAENDYDILYLGLSLNSKAENISEDLYQIERGWGLYAYIVNKSAYGKLLKLIPKLPDGINHENRTVSDVLVYDKIQPEKKCLLVPVCSVRDNFSNNWGRESNGLEQKIKDLYRKYCDKYTEKKEPKKTYNIDFNKYYDVVEKHSNSSGILTSYVINMEHCKERLLVFDAEQSKTKLISEIIRPVKTDDPKIIQLLDILKPEKPEIKAKELSNQMTFSRILKKAAADKIIIFEDDTQISNDFDEKLRVILSELPEDFGICYLGCYIKREFKLQKFSDNLIEFMQPTHKIWGAHATIFNQSVYKELSKALSKAESLQTDFEIAKNVIGQKRCFFAWPMIAMQNPEINSEMGHNLDFKRMERENPTYIEANLNL
jgi:GR25 family glycosyltransferase involved in LPS biosynthesis